MLATDPVVVGRRLTAYRPGVSVHVTFWDPWVEGAGSLGGCLCGTRSGLEFGRRTPTQRALTCNVLRSIRRCHWNGIAGYYPVPAQVCIIGALSTGVGHVWPKDTIHGMALWMNSTALVTQRLHHNLCNIVGKLRYARCVFEDLIPPIYITLVGTVSILVSLYVPCTLPGSSY